MAAYRPNMSKPSAVNKRKVRVYIYIYIYIYTHTHTHIYIYTYIFDHPVSNIDVSLRGA